jgi:O-antigen/teichoic acid export membrane protein
LTLLFLLPLVVFWPQTMGGRTLLPTENLFRDEPFATYREVAGAPAVPHNALLDDLVLENLQWKSFIRQSLAQGEIPLWNPHQFAGIPFMAAGQQSTLYPLSVLYYVLPLPLAYGWFTVVNLWLAGVFMYLFARGLGMGRAGGTLAGLIYQLSAFLLTSAVFPMIIGAAVWLPLILLMIEFTIRQRPLFGRPASVPWVMMGALALACNILAGHVELTYYTLIIAAYYAAGRLLTATLTPRPPLPQGEGEKEAADADSMRTRHGVSLRDRLKWLVERGAWLLAMVALGFGLGAVQFIPLLELVQTNWRSDSATFEQVLGWAHPKRDLIQFVMPNFYGSPAHHSYFDWFTMQTVTQFTNGEGNAITTIDWGMKNYVEGALYLGILPLALSVLALVDSFIRWRRNLTPRPPLQTWRGGEVPPYCAIFAILALVSLTFMFGLPTYALLYYGFPGLNQSHTPFRWIYAVTLSVAVLAGFGLESLNPHLTSPEFGGGIKGGGRRVARWMGKGLSIAGAAILLALLVSRVFYPQLEPLVERIFRSMALATNAFGDARMFYNYQFTNVLMFGLFTLGAGVVMGWAARAKLTSPPDPLSKHREGEKENLSHQDQPPSEQAKVPRPEGEGLRVRVEGWQLCAIALVALDLMVASWGFNPASDPALLDFTPPAIQWLTQQPGDWRYTTLDDPIPPNPRLMNANVGWRYGLDDIRGYESIIPKQYVDYMQALAPQVQLEFNRIAPLYTSDELNHFGGYHRALDSPLLDLLNVRYVMTHKTTAVNFQEWKLVYEDEAVRIWENDSLVPRAYLLPENDPTLQPDLEALSVPVKPIKVPESYQAATIVSDTGREKLVNVTLTEPAWLVVSESYFPGWRAFIRPQGAGEEDELPLEVQLVQGNFQGVFLQDAGDWTIRLVYSPASFQIGLFGTLISLALLLFIGGVWLWRLVVSPVDGESSGVSRVARNSLAPILLNLFNRGIDFGFAFIMLRILSPADAGLYQYAIVIFVWFDIFTNFGLNTFLTREVSRDKAHAGHYFFNTSVLRVALMLVGVVPLVIFILARQTLVTPPIHPEGLIALGLLYVGLLPNSLSTGLTALFYAFERAEYPSAVATMATISKTVFGVLALVLGFGIIGLAAVSIFTNVLTLVALGYGGRNLTPRPPLQTWRGGEEREPVGEGLRPSRALRWGTLDWSLMRGMMRQSWPLLLNHFLATIFFQIDVILIEGIHGSVMVAQYGVAYKWLSALNVIPAFFTMAMLPAMSRQAREDRPALKRNYTLSIKLLVSVALPTAVIFTFLAYVLTLILGGAQYLPDGAIATQLMIWSIPIGWMNSLTQYVLIALDLQRRITWAFMAAVTFNIVFNLLLIPQYGYQAAALITIASEAILWVFFVRLLHQAIGGVGWLDMLWRPVLAAGVMLVIFAVGWSIQPIVTLLLAVIAYPVTLLALRPLTRDEFSILSPLIPARLHKYLPTGN